MNEYEVTYLSDPQLTDEARSELDSTIDTLIDQFGGSISNSDPVTRRRLFYPINKQRVGFARALNIVLDPAKTNELRDSLKRQAGVLRTTILKTARRQEVTVAIFDEINKKVTPEAAAAKPEKSEKTVTMAEVEEKIEEALDEEVK